MNQTVIQGIVLMLMLAALPLTSIGSTSDLLWVSIVGLALIGLAALAPPILRFVGGSAQEDDGDRNEDEP